MEEYIVSARKYRPTTFSSVVGQGALTTTLKNAIHTGKLAHAYLFCGPRGVGKTTCARIFAKTINCLNPKENGDACEECESCKAFNEQRSFNIHELDAASNNSVDDIRGLIEEVRIPPQVGKYKVFIIDEVHMLSTSAFNAFLKTLEEPPRHAIFILATTEKHKILPTILSRCQIYDFSRMSVADIVRHLEFVAHREGVKAEPEALNVIAQKADGGMRDALSIFDQVVSFTEGNLTYDRVIRNLNVLDYEYYFKVVDCFLENKVAELLLLFNDIVNKGFQGDHFISGLAKHLRDLLVCRDAQTTCLLEVGDAAKQHYQAQAAKCGEKFLYAAMKLCNDCDLNYKASRNKRLLVELTLIQCAQLTQPDDSSAGGLRPATNLKPIFSTPSNEVAAPSVAAVFETKSTDSPKKSETVPQAGMAPPQTQENPVENPNIQNHFAHKATGAGKPVLKLKGGKAGGISIREIMNDGAQKEESKEVVQPESAPIKAQSGPKSTSVTQEQIRHYWNAFLQQLPQEDKAMRSRMETMNPTLVEPDVFEVTVGNQQVVQDLKTLKSRIEIYFQQETGNGHLQMKISLVAQEEVLKYLTPSDRFQVMCKENPAVEKLQKELGLHIVS